MLFPFHKQMPGGRIRQPTNARRIQRPIMSNNPNPNPVAAFEAKTVSLFSQPYLDTFSQRYINIVVVNLQPQGPLGELVRLVKFPPLSEFKRFNPDIKTCGYALQSFVNNNGLMVVDEVPTLISYLVSHGYKVDTSVTKMFNTSDIRFDTDTGNKLICFVTYQG
jgi:hypothetical protein